MDAEIVSTVVQVTNIAPQATRDQMVTLFSFIGKVLDLRLYPSVRDASVSVLSRVCFVRFEDAVCVAVAQHLTNTVFIDRAIIVSPVLNGEIPEEREGLIMATQFHQQGLTGNGVSRFGQPHNVNGAVVSATPVVTPFAKLTESKLPEYPVLPAGTAMSKADEIRRTVTVSNLDSTISAQNCMDFFAEAGEIKYFRFCTRPNDPVKYALIEFSDQDSVVAALLFNDRTIGSSKIKVTHAIQSITKPQTKSNEAVQKEIEEAMFKVKEAQSLVSAAVDPLMGILGANAAASAALGLSTRSSRSRSRSKSRRRSRSRGRSHVSSSKRSRSRDRRRRSRSRSRDRKRSRSRDRKRRSRSRDRKRSKRSRSRDRHRRSRSRDRKHQSASSTSKKEDTVVENGAEKNGEGKSSIRKSRSPSASRKRSKSRERRRKSRSRSRDRDKRRHSRSRSKDRKKHRSESGSRHRKRSRSRTRHKDKKSETSSKSKDKSKVSRDYDQEEKGFENNVSLPGESLPDAGKASTDSTKKKKSSISSSANASSSSSSAATTTTTATATTKTTKTSTAEPPTIEVVEAPNEAPNEASHEEGAKRDSMEAEDMEISNSP